MIFEFGALNCHELFPHHATAHFPRYVQSRVQFAYFLAVCIDDRIIYGVG